MHLKKIKILLLSTAILIAQQKNQPNIYASEIVSLITESDITIYEKKNGEYIKVEKPGKDATEIQIVLSGYKKELCWLKDYTKIESLKIYNLDNNTDLSFLPYLTNLKKFTIYEGKKGAKTNLEYLKSCENLESLEINSPLEIDFVILKDLKKLETLWIMNGIYINLELLKEYKNIRTLKIDVNENTPRNLIESLTHLKELKLYIEETESIEYQKLTFLEELSFGNSMPYSVIINFSTEDYDILKRHNVKIKSDKEGYMDKIISLNKELDDTINSLNLNNLYSKEKTFKIVDYVLKELTYDEKVAHYLTKNVDIRGYASGFYKEGLLYAAMESNSAICGNYAALLKALLTRVGIESYYLENSYHAWNLIKLDNNYYYIDPTLLDNQKLSKEWYLMNPLDVNDKFHQLEYPLQNLIRK